MGLWSGADGVPSRNACVSRFCSLCGQIRHSWKRIEDGLFSGLWCFHPSQTCFCRWPYFFSVLCSCWSVDLLGDLMGVFWVIFVRTEGIWVPPGASAGDQQQSWTHQHVSGCNRGSQYGMPYRSYQCKYFHEQGGYAVSSFNCTMCINHFVFQPRCCVSVNGSHLLMEESVDKMLNNFFKL